MSAEKRRFFSRWRRETERRGWWGRTVVCLVPGFGLFRWEDGGKGWHIVRLLRGRGVPMKRPATYVELAKLGEAAENGWCRVEERFCGKGGETHEVLLPSTGRGRPDGWISSKGGLDRVRVRSLFSEEYHREIRENPRTTEEKTGRREAAARYWGTRTPKLTAVAPIQKTLPLEMSHG